MPEPGDIISSAEAHALGLTGPGRWMWSVCPGCGDSRFTRYHRYKGPTRQCLTCRNKNRSRLELKTDR